MDKETQTDCAMDMGVGTDSDMDAGFWIIGPDFSKFVGLTGYPFLDRIIRKTIGFQIKNSNYLSTAVRDWACSVAKY
jgi:hypothetical protein